MKGYGVTVSKTSSNVINDNRMYLIIIMTLIRCVTRSESTSMMLWYSPSQ